MGRRQRRGHVEVPYLAWTDEPVERPPGRAAEDAFLAFPARARFVVADGVTRPLAPDGRYPDPSPARLAAECVVAAARQATWCDSPDTLLGASNRRVGELNDSLGLDNPAVVGPREPAGVVAAVAQVVDAHLAWAYVGDAGVALLHPRYGVLHETPDDVALARRCFPRSVTEPASRQVIHRLRNRPFGHAGSYGVLTGEDTAIGFIRRGTWPLDAAHVCVVFSDGFRPFLHLAPLQRLLCAALDCEEARRSLMTLVRARRSSCPDEFGDEASFIAFSRRGGW